MTGGLFAQGEFVAVDSEDPGVAGRRRGRGGNAGTRNKTQFHQARGNIGRKIDVIEDRLLAKGKLVEGLALLETRLHL